MQLACSHAPLSSVLCWHGPRGTRQISLSFDDGPHPTYTPRVLDLLAAQGVTATFFLLGQRVRRHPGIVRRMVEDGHEVGIHGWDHTHDDLPGQTLRTAEVLADLGIATRLFRPPNGRWTARLVAWMARRRYATVLWSVDSYDSARDRGRPKNTKTYDELAGGDIVLFHDDNEHCLADLPDVCALAASRNLDPTPISEIVRQR